RPRNERCPPSIVSRPHRESAHLPGQSFEPEMLPKRSTTRGREGNSGSYYYSIVLPREVSYRLEGELHGIPDTNRNAKGVRKEGGRLWGGGLAPIPRVFCVTKPEYSVRTEYSARRIDPFGNGSHCGLSRLTMRTNLIHRNKIRLVLQS